MNFIYNWIESVGAEFVEKIKFFKNDTMVALETLDKVKMFINNYSTINSLDNINDFFEAVNVYKFIETERFSLDWKKEDIYTLKKIGKNIKSDTFKTFVQDIDNKNIVEKYNETNYLYKEDFFYMLDKTISKIKLSDDVQKKFLEAVDYNLYELLQFKNIVHNMDKTISNYMVKNYNISAEILLDKYFKDSSNYTNVIIPKNLSMKDKCEIIDRYIEEDEKKYNYISIINKVHCTENNILLSDDIKLKAKKTAENLAEKIFNSNRCLKVNYGILVKISPNQDEVRIEKIEGNTACVSYSEDWIKNNLDYPTLLNNLIHVFEFVDYSQRINCLNHKSLNSLSDLFENKIKDGYNPNYVFKQQENIFMLSMVAYYEYLKKVNVRYENIIEWFFKDYLKSEFNISEYNISVPSKDSNYFEKIRTLLPELEFVLKQYKVFKEKGYINHELIEMSSSPCGFNAIPSLVDIKNVYVSNKNDLFDLIKYCFFSAQCLLCYDNQNKKSYKNFYSRLKSEKVNYNSYHTYEKKILDDLVKKDIIAIDKKGYIIIKNLDLVKLYGELYYKDFIIYWHADESIRKLIDSLITSGNLEFDNKLFSKYEVDYFNYHLNMKSFSDGNDIRNSNLHGTQKGDKDSSNNYDTYMKILFLLSLIIIKINDDICINDKLTKSNN